MLNRKVCKRFRMSGHAGSKAAASEPLQAQHLALRRLLQPHPERMQAHPHAHTHRHTHSDHTRHMRTPTAPAMHAGVSTMAAAIVAAASPRSLGVTKVSLRGSSLRADHPMPCNSRGRGEPQDHNQAAGQQHLLQELYVRSHCIAAQACEPSVPWATVRHEPSLASRCAKKETILQAARNCAVVKLYAQYMLDRPVREFTLPRMTGRLVKAYLASPRLTAS